MKKKSHKKQYREHTPTADNQLTFLGGVGEVTGSCYLIDYHSQRLLLECGLRQGGESNRRMRDDTFAFDPTTLDAVILSHAHLDHSGLLPLLINQGYSGPIYCTQATRYLLKIMLQDSAHLYWRDLEYSNRRLERSGRKPLPPLYTQQDVDRVQEQCVAIEYHECRDILQGVSVCFHDAGHILGSAIVELTLQADKSAGEKTCKLVFSGDLGNADSALMSPPDVLHTADIVLLEGTYGNRNHRPMTETLDEFVQALEQAKRENGTVLIPSFAVGRTQEILFHLGKLYHEGKLHGWRVYLDSPMAIAVTKLYDDWMDTLDPQDIAVLDRYRNSTLEKFLPALTVIESPEQSMALNKIESGAIIIAGSGMCTGGRIRHHLKHRIWKKNTHVIIVGFQAMGTLGRMLVDGAKSVMMFGEKFSVKASVHTLGGFSAHAGQSQLAEWVGQIKSAPQVYLVHGEPEALGALAQYLRDERGITAQIAQKGVSIAL